MKQQSEVVKSAILEAARADLASVYRLAYVSQASPLFGPRDLEEIGKKSAEKNSEADITGILVMDDGKILQILEGDESAVTALYAKISGDPRHQNVQQVSGAEQSARLLSCWSMVGGKEASAPSNLMTDFHKLHQRLRERPVMEDVTAEEIELLKVIALFRSVPL